MSHILYDPTSKLLGSWDLFNEETRNYYETTLTIKEWRYTTGEFEKNGQTANGFVCFFEENVKPMWMGAVVNREAVMAATNVLSDLDLPGKQITIFVDKNVKVGKKKFHGLRIRRKTAFVANSAQAKAQAAQAKEIEQAVQDSILLLESCNDLDELRATFGKLTNSKDVRVRAKADELKIKLSK